MISRLAGVSSVVLSVLSPVDFATPRQIPAALVRAGADSVHLPMLHGTIQRGDLITTMQGLRSSIAQLEDRELPELLAAPREPVHVQIETGTDSVWVTPVIGREKDLDGRQAASFLAPETAGVYNFVVEAFWKLPTVPNAVEGHGRAVWGLRVIVR